MIIDAHQHFWQIGRPDHEWPTPELASIFRDFDEDDYRDAAPGIAKSVLVQAQPRDSDTDWLLAAARASDRIAGVVGWADLSADTIGTRVAELSKQTKLKGLRPMLQGLADDEWVLRDSVKPGLKVMTDNGLRFDALIHPRHLPVIDRLARLWPELAIVIDHCAKPAIGQDDGGAWRDALARAANNSNVYCKLSGLVTETADTKAIDAVTAYADHVFDLFGPDRILWGSDWPVVTLRCPLTAWLDWTQTWLAGKTASAGDLILGDTARRFYHLN